MTPTRAGTTAQQARFNRQRDEGKDTRPVPMYGSHMFISYRHSSLRSTTQVHQAQKTHVCTYCSAPFSSRNALFRHLEQDVVCSLERPDRPRYIRKQRESFALLFGYCPRGEDQADDCDCDDDNSTDESSVHVGQVLQELLTDCLLEQVQELIPDSTAVDVQFVGSTQSSIARLRSRALGQEPGCAAAGDVLVVNLDVPDVLGALHQQQRETLSLEERILKFMQSKLNELQQVQSGHSSEMEIRCVACKKMNVSLHAERSCTQYIYQYLLPLHWLPGTQDLQDWVMGSQEERPPKESLRPLKVALRKAECEKYVDDKDGDRRKAAGRFGALALTERRPWHNFADPRLLGDASPSNEPVWRALDRARIVGLENICGQAIAVLEFRGDAFVQQQVRRLVGTAVAVAHEWLPESVVVDSTRSDLFVEMPLAPAGRLYLAGTRFHFDELRASGKSLFETNVSGNAAALSSLQDNTRWVQETLLEKKTGADVTVLEDDWLRNLGEVIVPSLKRSLAPDESVNGDDTHLLSTLLPPSKEYHQVLTMLRTIVAAEEWPETSVARSEVIRPVENPKEARNAGSFTVVNTELGESKDSSTLPFGHNLFPDLSKAIFDLEAKLAEQDIDVATSKGLEPNTTDARRPSSHCAVNCNAAFTPHVDSGKGSGQSLSLIVGLGDYVGGELSVEGNDFDIRYRPLEFDGWKLRHWTQRFQGERFSLVWFTAESY